MWIILPFHGISGVSVCGAGNGILCYLPTLNWCAWHQTTVERHPFDSITHICLSQAIIPSRLRGADPPVHYKPVNFIRCKQRSICSEWVIGCQSLDLCVIDAHQVRQRSAIVILVLKRHKGSLSRFEHEEKFWVLIVAVCATCSCSSEIIVRAMTNTIDPCCPFPTFTHRPPTICTHSHKDTGFAR